MGEGSPKIFLAAGGTGGHIYPAIALAQALRRKIPGVEIRFCCGSRPGELAIYRAAGVEPLALPLSGRRAGLANGLRFLRELAASYPRVRAALREFKPDLAVGFGNYLSVPALVAARRLGARTALHEQNSTPGLANRWLARRADLVLTGLPVKPGLFPDSKTLRVGNPVREDLLVPVDRARARRELGLPESGPICLCFGGSLGARGVNALLQDALPKFAANSLDSSEKICDPSRAVEPPCCFLWAAGREQHATIQDWLDRRPELAGRVALFPYLERMDLAYAAADWAVARAGASTLAELAALGKPAILIPLPRSAGDHQRANARAMAEAGAAEMIEEGQPGAADLLAERLIFYAQNGDMLNRMGKAARGLGLPQAAQDMAEAVLRLLETRRRG